MIPTQEELGAAIKDENEAMLAFIEVSHRLTALEIEKAAARHNLTLARAHKKALLDDAMNYA